MRYLTLLKTPFYLPFRDVMSKQRLHGGLSHPVNPLRTDEKISKAFIILFKPIHGLTSF